MENIYIYQKEIYIYICITFPLVLYFNRQNDHGRMELSRTISNNFPIYRSIDTRQCIRKGKHSSVIRILSSAEISQTYEILRGWDAGVIPGVPGWISPNAFVSFAAVTALPALCMLPFDYSYAIAFYDRLDTATRFHHASNRGDNRPGNVLVEPWNSFSSRHLYTIVNHFYNGEFKWNNFWWLSKRLILIFHFDVNCT